MASKPTQRSLAHLRKYGWQVAIVEKWLPARGSMKFGIRQDVWTFADLLACRPPVMADSLNGWVDIPGRIALIQTTTGHGGGFAAHRRKMLGCPELEIWKRSGGLVFLHGWRFGGPRGERKRWLLREEQL